MKFDILPDPIEFEWDKGNIEKNLSKHGVMTEEAEEVFVGEPVIWEDEKHSGYETRYQCLGISRKGKKFFVCFTIRDNRIRIISVRPMSKSERRSYEKEI